MAVVHRQTQRLGVELLLKAVRGPSVATRSHHTPQTSTTTAARIVSCCKCSCYGYGGWSGRERCTKRRNSLNEDRGVLCVLQRATSRQSQSQRRLFSTGVGSRGGAQVDEKDVFREGNSSSPHVPVLLEEVVKSFEGCELRVFVDATLGAAGHAYSILQAHPEIELYIGIDTDPTALALAEQRLQPFRPKLRLIHGNFRQFKSLVADVLREEEGKGKKGGSEVGEIGTFSSSEGKGGVDGILADLGVSSMQIDTDHRGFSFMREGPLDMRMDPEAPLSAWNVVNHYSEQELGRIFRDFGEERHWRKLARAVVSARAEASIDTTSQLAEVISNNSRRNFRKGKGKGKGKGKAIHPATRVFQAVRIEVNGELEAIDSGLPPMVDFLNSGGRIGVISFHSLEDRRIKRAFMDYSGRGSEGSEQFQSVSKLERYTGVSPFEGERETESGDKENGRTRQTCLRMPRRKPVVASEQEAELNPRSRSAKYRCAEKL